MRKVIVILLFMIAAFLSVSCKPRDIRYRMEYAVHYPDTTVIERVIVKERPRFEGTMGTPKLNFYPMRASVFLPCEIINIEEI